MCGVSVFISLNATHDRRRVIDEMNKAVRHRGPDDSGVLHLDDFSLGHTRLSIIDLSVHGHQPMQYQQRYWISYNGEIYNYLELREALVKLGRHFDTNTDTEVVLAAYAEWGADALQRFNGMWAFVIYDSVENTLFISRDRFGIKPLYMVHQPGKFLAFASEIKQLLTLVTPQANRKTVIESLLTHIDGHNRDTFFDGVSAFPQAHYGKFSLADKRLELRRFYRLEFEPDPECRTTRDAIERFESLFVDSVRLRMRSDVQVGTCLSGGLDSSAVSAIASGVASNDYKFVGVHAKSTDNEVDESMYAETVAESLGIDFQIAEPSVEDFRCTIDDVVWTQEEPFGSPSMVMGWNVFKRAAELGCKVMLNGQGGDEVLLGYERYLATALWSMNPVEMARNVWSMGRNSSLGNAKVAAYYFYFTNFRLRKTRLLRNTLLKQSALADYDFSVLADSCRSFRNVEKLQKSEIESIQLPHLLRYEDRNSMRHSIETRLPFLDYRLVEFCGALPLHLKINKGWSKYILRRCLEHRLPASIIWRRNKLGFQAPERTWLAAHRQEMVREIKGSSILGKLVDMNLLEAGFDRLGLRDQWRYFSVAAWERIYGVRSW